MTSPPRFNSSNRGGYQQAEVRRHAVRVAGGATIRLIRCERRDRRPRSADARFPRQGGEGVCDYLDTAKAAKPTNARSGWSTAASPGSCRRPLRSTGRFAISRLPGTGTSVLSVARPAVTRKGKPMRQSDRLGRSGELARGGLSTRRNRSAPAADLALLCARRVHDKISGYLSRLDMG
jgi:hypothetical protein